MQQMFESYPGFHSIIPNTPTCYRDNAGSFIDFFIISDELTLQYQVIQTIPSFSDHLGIQLSVNLLTSNHEPTVIHGLFQYNYTKVKQLNTFLDREFVNLNIPIYHNHNHHELEQMATSIDKIFSEALHRFVPHIPNLNNKIMLSNSTIAIKRNIRSLIKKLPNRNYPTLLLKNNIKLLQNMYRNSLRFDIVNYYSGIIANTGQYHSP